jgi:hypothetical protein
MKSIGWDAKYEEFGGVYFWFYQSLGNMVFRLSDDEVKALYSDIDKPTSSNCSWMLFQVAPILKRVLEEAIRTRGITL